MHSAKHISHLIVCCMAIMLIACQPDTGCRLNTDVTIGVGAEWVSVDTLGHGTIIKQWDTVTIQGVGLDSILYYQISNVNEVRLHLRQDTSETQYSIQRHGQTDILHIRHQNRRQYLSMACGCVVYHTIDTVWSDGVFIQSAEIVNSAVSTENESNIIVKM